MNLWKSFILALFTALIGFGLAEFRSCNDRQRKDTEIKFYKDSIISYKTKLNDTTEIFVTERIVSQKTTQDLKYNLNKAEEKIIKLSEALNIKKRHIKNLSQASALIKQGFAVKLNRVIKDSIEYTVATYEDKFRKFASYKKADVDTIFIQDSIVAPITQIIHKGKKSEYKKRRWFGAKFVAWILEKRPLTQTVTSENPSVEIIAPLHIKVTKKR